jgi:hypothetical protein
MDRDRRRQLADEYRLRPREAAVYLIRDGRSGRALLASTPDLASLRNRFDFALATGTASAIDGRITTAIAPDGLDALSLEVIDVLEVDATATEAQVRDDLAALEAAWREKLASSLGE